MKGLLPALVAIGIWSSLALLSTLAAGLPPLFTTGVALSIGGLAGLFRIKDWPLPTRTFLVGLGGIFGYHALLFAAFALAPALEINLLNYLWPLLIVVLSPLVLPGLRLNGRHIFAALLGLAGALLIALGSAAPGAAAAVHPGRFLGYALAATAALVWALYSLLTKRLPPFPTGAVGGFCLASGLLALALYALTKGGGPLLPPLDPGRILALVALGLGPMGLAFYAWDYALKRGDPRVIGSLAYLTPLLSTLNLVVFAGKRMDGRVGLALLLIVGGAVLGSLGGSKKA